MEGNSNVKGSKDISSIKFVRLYMSEYQEEPLTHSASVCLCVCLTEIFQLYRCQAITD